MTNLDYYALRDFVDALDKLGLVTNFVDIQEGWFSKYLESKRRRSDPYKSFI